MPKRTDKLLIRDIIESCESIFEYCGLMSIEEFMINKLVRDAVVRNFEVIGEASKQISETTKDLYPFIEWQPMSDFRNKLIHEYFGVDYTIVYDIIKNTLPFNYEQLCKIGLV